MAAVMDRLQHAFADLLEQAKLVLLEA